MISFADLFCGAGGATTGVLLAAERKSIAIKDGVAINHWPVAVETHSANHPHIRHLCESIERVDPCEAVPSGKLDLLWASPECTHHSRARGGKPRQNQSRAGASHILTWLDKLYIRNVIIENVPEFQDWGPLDAHGQPLKSKKGENFRTFIESLKARNYNVDYRVLNAADFGDATTRRRLFVIARRKPLKIIWPEPTHRRPEDCEGLFGKSKSWRPAREIIDWSDIGTRLSDRPRPLKPNTMRRIFAGLEKFCGLSFVLPTNNFDSDRVAGTDEPLETLATKAHPAVVTPLIVTVDRPITNRSKARSVNESLPTITTNQRIGLATPFLIQTDQTGSNGKCVYSVEKPLPTSVTKQNRALITPKMKGGFLVSLAHGNKSKKDNSRRAIDADKPLPTTMASNKFGVVQSFLVSTKHGKDKRIKSADEPLPTLCSKGEHALVQLPDYIVNFRGTKKVQLENAAAGTDQPLGTLSTKDHHALCRPFLVRLRGTDDSQIKSCAKSVEVPLDTVSTTGKHHALIQCLIKCNCGHSFKGRLNQPCPACGEIQSGHVTYPNSFLTSYYGSSGGAQSVEDPLDSVTTKDRFMLVNPTTNEAHELEIYFRLLKPQELWRAHSFSDTYKFSGNKTQIVKQIGNSNPVELTAALTAVVL